MLDSQQLKLLLTVGAICHIVLALQCTSLPPWLPSPAGFCVDPETKACTVPKVWSNADRSFSCPGEWHPDLVQVTCWLDFEAAHRWFTCVRTIPWLLSSPCACPCLCAMLHQQITPSATRRRWRRPWRSRSRPTPPLPTVVREMRLSVVGRLGQGWGGQGSSPSDVYTACRPAEPKEGQVCLLPPQVPDLPILDCSQPGAPRRPRPPGLCGPGHERHPGQRPAVQPGEWAELTVVPGLQCNIGSVWHGSAAVPLHFAPNMPAAWPLAVCATR